jgi:hypothetical protein
MPQDKITREMKVQLIKAVFNKEKFNEIVAKASPYELSDIQEFLWDAVLYLGKNDDGTPITRDAITARMMPTTEYWRSQLCGEPLDTCRGRSCFVSHPVCAGNKLKGQIDVIRQLFERRKQRAEHDSDGLLMLMMYHVNDHHYAAGGIYSIDRRPQLTVGSRVLSGDALRNVIQAMNVAVGQSFNESPMCKKIIIGDNKLNVHARTVKKTSESDEVIVALTVPENEPNENLEKVFKRMEAGIRRISTHLN